MRLNWRSDAAMLTALDALFDGVTFGDQSIGFVPVTAARASQTRHIGDDDGPLPALSVRLAVGAGIVRTKQGKEVVVDAAAAAIESDLVANVCDLLDNARLPAGTDGAEPRKVRPDDIAVLVTTNDQCSSVQAALTGQGIPAVVANAGNVLTSPAADQMRWLLDAMTRPSDPRRARTYALSWFGGWSADEVAAASDADLSAIQEDLRDWSERLATHPVADVLARVWSASGVVATVLSSPDGDRNMTDLDHLVELLHRSTPTGRSNVAGLLATLDNSGPRRRRRHRGRRGGDRPADRVGGRGRPGHDRVDGQGARVPHRLPPDALAPDRRHQPGDLRRPRKWAEGLRCGKGQDVARRRRGEAEEGIGRGGDGR